MLPICQVCLRTDRKLQVIDDTLDDFYDDICDYAACQVQSAPQFCSECAYMLRKFNDFKEKCRQAVKILKSWKTQKSAVRQPITHLSTQMPQSHLSLCNKQNFKLYFYRAANLDSHIANISNGDEATKLQPFDYNIIQSDCIFETDIKIEPEKDDVTETLSFEDNVQYNVICKNETENEANSGRKDYKFSENEVNATANEVDISGNEGNDTEFEIKHLIDDSGIKTESDSSDDEVLILKRKTKTLDSLVKTLKTTSDKKDLVKKRCKRVQVNTAMLKQRLVTRFRDNEELKDDEGTVIDKELILNSLEKMPQRKLQHMWNITDSNTLTAEAIKLFSHTQKKYSEEYSSVFSTEFLPSKDQVEAEFKKRREDASYVSSEHKCEMCYRGFKYKKMLDFHVRVQHDECRPHVCPVCRMRFNSDSSLRWHTSSHSTVFKCKLCPLVTNYRKTMLDHYHYHNGDTYSCPLCQATFKSRSGLCLHSIRAHPTRHECSVCARTFASERGLKAHTRLKHQNEEIPVNPECSSCEQCDATFVSEDALQRHLVTTHGHATPHKKRRKYTPNFICPVCKITEHSYGAMNWHFKTEHPALNFRDMYSHKHLCHICGKGYSSLSTLEEHKNVHTGAKPYLCGECPAAFGSRASLAAHQERHRPRARRCPHCDKKFVSASNLNNHMKQHSGLRSHKCQLCEKSFMHSNTLNEHVRGVHYHIRRTRKKPPAYKQTAHEQEITSAL